MNDIQNTIIMARYKDRAVMMTMYMFWISFMLLAWAKLYGTYVDECFDTHDYDDDTDLDTDDDTDDETDDDANNDTNYDNDDGGRRAPVYYQRSRLLFLGPWVLLLAWLYS